MQRYIYSMVALLLLSGAFRAQQAIWDSLGIRYQLLQNEYHQDENIVKIMLPPFLPTSEVIQQIKLAIRWPGDPEVDKLTRIYIYTDGARVGDVSATGAVFVPGEGFTWFLDGWEPDASMLGYEPTGTDIEIYNSLLDNLYEGESFNWLFEIRDHPSKQVVAEEHGLTTGELDSIYYRVRWWLKTGGHTAELKLPGEQH